MYKSSSPDVIMAALGGRSWKAIKLRAWRIGLKRKGDKRADWRSWTLEEDYLLESYCQDGVSYEEISKLLNRSVDSVVARVRDKSLSSYIVRRNQQY